HLAVGRAPQAVEEERLAPEEAAAPHEEELQARLAPLAREPRDVLVHGLGRDDLLSLAHRVQRLHAVAEDRGLLDPLLRGRGLHRLRQVARDVVVLALEEALDRLDGALVPLARLPARARRVAAVDEVLDARPLELAVDRDPARAEREELA